MLYAHLTGPPLDGSAICEAAKFLRKAARDAHKRHCYGFMTFLRCNSNDRLFGFVRCLGEACSKLLSIFGPPGVIGGNRSFGRRRMVTVGSSRSSAAHGKSSAVKVSPESSERPKVFLAAKTYANDP